MSTFHYTAIHGYCIAVWYENDEYNNNMVSYNDVFLSYVPREVDSRTATLLYLISSILLLSISSNVSSFFLSWIATLLILIHIFRLSSFKTPLIAHWRILLLLGYGISSSILLSFDISSSNGVLSDNYSYAFILGIVGVIISSVTLLILFIFPLPGTPHLRGKFIRVGTNSFILPKSGGRTVQVWFPISNSKPLSWWKWLFLCERKKSVMWTSGHPLNETKESKKLHQAISKIYNIPEFLFSHLYLARCRAEWCDEINILSLGEHDKYPVAIYSHGLKGWRQGHHTACEALASYGFMVFAIDHYPDAIVTRPHLEPEKSQMFDFAYPDDGTYGPAYRAFYRKGLERRTLDIKTLLDYLTSIPTLVKKLELKNVFIWGHSYGGGTSATVAALDARIAGAVLLDSWMFPVPDDIRRLGTKAPVVSFSSEHWSEAKEQVPFMNDFLKHSKSKLVGSWYLQGTDHCNFSDVVHLASKFLLIRQNTLGRQANPNTTIQAIDRFICSYFLSLAHSTTFLDSITRSSHSESTSEETKLMIQPNHLPQLLDKLIQAQNEIKHYLGTNFDIIDDYYKRQLVKMAIDVGEEPKYYDGKLWNKVNDPNYNKDVK